ncbi:centromere-associated protein E-like isoform X2 [Sceloporus undulatus]|uniref:centromere-associated protein E-like isoform X2 n=1 Tax=Sceloporus undulatus TaxID=8520 RepID=UPI001C4AD7C1|nr:centromere-associated protein E-like isoform X2 [Sceloporus undulatus]
MSRRERRERRGGGAMAGEGGVRVRPLLAREEEDLGDEVQMAWKSEDCTVSQIDGDKSFTFGTIFAYGQAASGKAHTMLGTRDCPGVLPMAIHDVYNTIYKIPGREFLLRISYMEIRNETVQDLLCSNMSEKRPLAVHEDINLSLKMEELQDEEREMEELLCESQWKQNDQLQEELKVEKMEKLEMAQRLCDSEEEREALTQERDDLRQKCEVLQTERESFRDLEKETTLKIKKLEEECLRQKQSLELKEEQSQEDEGRLGEMEQSKASTESKMEAIEKEKAELAKKFHTTVEDVRSITMENANLKITVESLQSEKVSMIQSVHRLSKTIERTVAQNLELQEQLQHAHSAIEAHTKMVAELKGEIRDKEPWSSELQKTLKQEAETEMEILPAQIRHQEEKISNMNNMIDEKTNLLQKLEANEQLKEELSLHISEKERLAAELRNQADKVQQLTRETSLLPEERKKLQEDLQSLKAENGQLQEKLLQNTAKAQLNKGAELYKEEIEDLKTQLAKADMGDSGGPLVCGTGVHGIVSFNGKRCGSGKYPDVYTQISKYIP